MNYLGHLSHQDHLYDYLKYDVMPQLGVHGNVGFRVFKLNGSNDVYLYEEKHSLKKVIGKFFCSNGTSKEQANRKLEREFHHLELIRYYGMDGRGPHYVAKPLGKNHDLNELLVEEYCDGELFSHVIERAILTNDKNLLYSKLTALAYFLSKLHNNTVNDYHVDFDETTAYMNSLNIKLYNQNLIDDHELKYFYYLRDSWSENANMWEDRQTLVHGDATPENFLFGDNLYVMTFDLERLRRSDRLYDVGRVAGELAHFFMIFTNNRYNAEPFIGHFLWEYSCHFPDRKRAFESISRRVAFFMGINFLRIARNDYLGWEYRKRLIAEGKECLESIFHQHC